MGGSVGMGQQFSGYDQVSIQQQQAQQQQQQTTFNTFMFVLKSLEGVFNGNSAVSQQLKLAIDHVTTMSDFQSASNIIQVMRVNIVKLVKNVKKKKIMRWAMIFSLKT
jgi:hypothetical protein